jgi:hypothetical protein
LADNLRFFSVIETANAAGRERVREEQEVALLQFAPGTSIAIAEFHKINRAIELSAPTERLNFAHALINLHKRTRPEERIKREILKANIAVEGVPQIELLQKGDGHFPPNLNHAGQEVGIVEVEGTIEADGERHGFFRVVDFQRGQVGVGQGRKKLVKGRFLQIHTEEVQQVNEFNVIDGGQGIKLENAGDGIGILQLREPSVGNLELRVLFFFGDFLTQVLDIPRGNPQADPQASQLVTGQR